MLGIKHEIKPIVIEIKNNHHSSLRISILFKLKLKLDSIKFEIKRSPILLKKHPLEIQ